LVFGVGDNQQIQRSSHAIDGLAVHTCDDEGG
jgi:hypothetical protein